MYLRTGSKNLVRVVPHNPFVNPAPWTCYEVFKLVVASLTLLPLRLLCLLPLVLGGFLLACIATAGLRLEDREGCFCTEPLAPWRRRCLAPATLIFRGVLWCLGFWHIEIIDRRRDTLRVPKVLVVAPHMTWVDALVIAWAFPPFPAGVGDSLMLKAPCGRRLAVASQGVFVNVRNKESKESCRRIVEQRSQPSWPGPPTMIFPEGRITNGEMLIQFKLGAFQAGQPVLPVVLRYPFKHFNPACCGSNVGPLWPLRMMTQFANFCKVEVLEVVVPSPAERSDAVLYAQEVRLLMATAAGLDTTEHNYDDAFLYTAARQARVVADFEVRSMCDLFSVDLKQLTTWLQVFRTVDSDHDGLIARSDFKKVIGASFPFRRTRDARSLDRLFDFFDTDGSGTIEYREFVQGLALFSGKCDPGSMVKLAFLVYDVEGNGRVSRSVLRGALSRAFAQRSFGQSGSMTPLGSGRRALRRVHASTAEDLEMAMQASKRHCAGKCGYAVTWDTTHCCIACASHSGEHGATCDRLPCTPRCRQPSTVSDPEVHCRTVGDMLLPETPRSSDGDALGSGEELDFASFCQLAQQSPEILEEALGKVYTRLGCDDGQDASLAAAIVAAAAGPR